MTDLVAPAPAPAAGHLDELRRRLATDAAAAGLLDVAYRTVASPIGELLVAVTPAGLVRVAFATEGFDDVLAELAHRVSPRLLGAPGPTESVARQLDDYFAGRRRRFDVPLDLRLATGFRRDVVSHLAEIPYGRTVTYAELARMAGRPAAVRAAASGCAHNPVPVVVPCHRVVRSDGTIGRYRGGVDAKATLLTLEAA